MAFETLIDAGSLQELLGKPGLAVLDCRFDLMNPEAGLRAYGVRHIPGARYVDLNRDLSAPVTSTSGRHPLPAPEVFAARLGALGIRNESQVVAYDESNGSFAARLWWMMRWLGHRSAAVLDGGFKAWIAAGGALQSGDEAAPLDAYAASLVVNGAAAPFFSPRVDPDAVLSGIEVSDALRNGRTMLVDARAPERFAGTVEPIDPVAGHVPGAVNHPFSENLAPDGRFLQPAVLRHRWQERLAGTAPQDVVAMCGSGVTACHNLLGLEVAGLGGAKLYAGSWSEWIRDPRRPVAKGAGPPPRRRNRRRPA